MKEVYDVDVHFPGNSSIKWFRTDLDGNWAAYTGGSVASVHADLDTVRNFILISHLSNFQRNLLHFDGNSFPNIYNIKVVLCFRTCHKSPIANRTTYVGLY